MKLAINAVIKYISGLILVGVLLFPAAGTMAYPNAWIFIALLFIPMFILGLILFFKAPELLRKRLNSKEKEKSQKAVILISLVMFLGGFIGAGLDFRFGWTEVPGWLVAAACVLLLLSYALYAEVMRENAYLSRTVEVQEGQKLVDTGLYAVVRHPMYSATILLFMSIPLVLGSWLSFVLFLVYPAAIVLRIKNEEEVLEQGLAGYTEYKNKVRYRLIPGIW